MSISPTNQNAQTRKHYSGIKLLSIIAGGCFLLLVATMLVPSVLNVDYMFTMGAVLVVLPLASLAMGKMWMRGLSAERFAVDPIVEGESRKVSVRVRQRFPVSVMLEVDDSLPDGLTSMPQMPVALLAQDAGTEFWYSLLATRRGVYRLGAVRLRLFDPLGVVGLTKRCGDESEVVVYPRPLAISDWTFVAESAAPGHLGDILSRPTRGASADFCGIRKYSPGDDLRRIHWKSVARVHELVVKEFLDEAHVNNVLVVVDTDRGASYATSEETSLDYACRAAAYVAERTLSLNGRVSLATGATPGAVSARAESLRDLPLIMDPLARSEANAELPLADVLMGLEPHLHQGSALVVIGSKVDERLRRAVRRIMGRGVAVAQVYVDPSSFGSSGSTRSIDYLLDTRIPCWKIGPRGWN